MSRYRLLWIVLGLLLVMPPSVTAQTPDQSTWEVLVGTYDGEQYSLVTLNQDGIVRTVPAPSYQGVVSPDRHYMAAIVDSTVSVANLAAETCCETLSLPVMASVEDPIPYESPLVYHVGAFSPDSTQLAIGYYFFHEFTGEATAMSSGIIVIDLEPLTVRTTWEDPLATLSLTITDWREEGIVYLRPMDTYPPPEAVAPCFDVYRSDYFLWDPATGEPAGSVGRVVLHGIEATGDRLEVNGEYIGLHYRTVDDPYNPDAGGKRYAAVVEYYPPATTETPRPEPVMIYAEWMYWPYGLECRLLLARWVLDGQAIILGLQDGSVALLYRDGTQRSLESNQAYGLLTGVPDGWLTYQYDFDAHEDVFYHYRVEGGEVVRRELTRMPSTGYVPTVLEATPLGRTASGVFPPVDLPTLGVG